MCPDTNVPAGQREADMEVAELVNQARLATLGMLVAGLAHEINTPLGAIHSNHDVLKRALQKLQDILADEVVEPHELDEVRRIVRAIDGVLSVNDMAVERMTGLVGSLRSFGRIDRADIDVVDLHEGLESTLAILAHELRKVFVERDFGDTPRIECHPLQVNQVFMNLLLNACQASEAGGTVRIGTRRRGDGVEVVVEDEGVGIPPENLGRIFEPGFTTRQGRIGMGLGLLISRQIVERHHGRIEVTSEPGRGSRFTVWLPVRYHAGSGSSRASPSDSSGG